MSIQYMENFSNYGTGVAGVANMSDNTPWITLESAANNLPVDPDGASGGLVLRLSTPGSNNYIGGDQRIACSTPDKQIGVACRWWLTTLPVITDQAPTLNFMNVANELLYQMRFETNGSLSVRRGTSALANTTTELGNTVSPIVSTGAWNHLEILVDTLSGDIEVHKEGVPVAALTVTDGVPLNEAIGIIVFSPRSAPSSGTSGVFIKDLITWDNGGTVNNDFLGPCTVYTLVPTTDVSSGWSPSTGTSNAAILDSNPPNDAQYISAGTAPPAPSIVNLSDLPADVVAVRGLQTMVRMQKSDGGDATVQVSLLSNGDADPGADRAVSATFSYWLDISEFDPDTLAPWSPVAVNSATLQINRTT